ncbi:MAG TPA: signal peptide peptidase SppA [Nitrospiria bacterium]|jgi:protease-4|nr:signal peptide peptidase SppA [Nitrospiria bacterium]
MKKHPLMVGLILLAVLAALFFIMTYSAAVMQAGGGLLGDRIALIKIEGVILDSSDTIEELHRYDQNSGIKAIILRIDSPGGGVVPSQEIYEEVKKIREEGQKKVVVSMGTVAASGGYYIASASNRIVASPGTLTGSIGVIMELANVEGLFKKIGVESVVIKSGRNKDIGSPFRKMQPEERAILQSLMDDVHDQFIQAVAEGRGLEEDRVRRMADGRVFTGREAKQLGLVDDIGDLQDTIRLTADLVGIKGEPRIVESRKRTSLLDLFRDQFLGRLPSMQLPQTGVSLKYLMAF